MPFSARPRTGMIVPVPLVPAGGTDVGKGIWFSLRNLHYVRKGIERWHRRDGHGVAGGAGQADGVLMVRDRVELQVVGMQPVGGDRMAVDAALAGGAGIE